VARDGFNTDVRNLRARLTQNAARALNGAFGVTAFKRGLTLGRVTVRSETNETELAATGATALAVDAGALQALTSLGIAPGVIGPATLEGTTASFPITGGESELDLDPALVRHSGGLSLTKGATVVRLTDFDIVLGGEAGPQLLASLNGGEEKVAILDLDLTGVTPAVQGRAITVSRRHREAFGGRRAGAQPGLRDDRVRGRAGARQGDGFRAGPLTHRSVSGRGRIASAA
jgi:hypothetical protein